jgi:hypothetical protein
MANLGLVLLVFAFVCAFLAMIGVSQPHPRLHLGWAAIMFWIAATIFGGVGRLFGTH